MRRPIVYICHPYMPVNQYKENRPIFIKQTKCCSKAFAQNARAVKA